MLHEEKLEYIKSKAAELCGLVERVEEATIKDPHFPFIAIVDEKQDYTTSQGKVVRRLDYTPQLKFQEP